MIENLEGIIDDMAVENDKTIDNLNTLMSGLRTNRPSTTLLEQIKVEVYGSISKLEHIATVTIKDRTLIIQPWDKSTTRHIEKAIMSANLSLNPITEGDVIRVAFPELNQQMRDDLTKKASEYAEKAKISIRSARRDAIDALKRVSKEFSEDLIDNYKTKAQKIIDANIAKVDDILDKRVKAINAI